MESFSGTRKLALMALFVTLALMLSYIETFVPMVIPGAKLGLANIVTLTALVIFGLKEAGAIVLIRTTISAFLFTSVSTLMYALPAGLVSLCAMCLMLKISKKDSGLLSVSMIGAVSHNLTQIVVAMFVLEQMRVMAIMPWLILLAVPTGLIVGYVSKLMIRMIDRSIIKTNH